jgi:hypothetical protein
MTFFNEARLVPELKSKGVSRKDAKTQRKAKLKFMLYVFLRDFAALRETDCRF